MKAKVWGTWWGPFPEYVSIIKHEMTLCLRGWEYDSAEGRSLFGLYSEKKIWSQNICKATMKKGDKVKLQYIISK